MINHKCATTQSRTAKCFVRTPDPTKRDADLVARTTADVDVRRSYWRRVEETRAPL